MPKFSIITVCLNEANSIRLTCESVSNLTCKNYEWIVIDGGSKDETCEILGEYDSCISTLVSEDDNGVYDAMNKGVDLARGDYLIFMNGGDAFASKDILEYVIESPQKDLISGNLFVDKIGGIVVKSPSHLAKSYLYRRKQVIHHQATFFHKRLFKEFGLYDTRYKICGDYDYYLRLASSKDVSYHHLDIPVAVFHMTGMSSIDKFSALRDEEYHQIRLAHFPQYRWSLRALRHILRK